MLSIFVPAYNAATTIERLFASLKPLPPERVELLFVDDGSADNTAALIEAFAASRLNTRLIRHPRNRGAAAAINTGIEEVRGNYMQGCSADDYLYADGVVRALNIAEAGNFEVVFQGYKTQSEDGHIESFTRQPPKAGQSILESWWLAPRHMDGAIMLRSDLARAVRYREDLTLGEETIRLIEIFARTKSDKVGYSEHYSYHYFIVEGAKSHPRPAQLPRYAERMLERLKVQHEIGERLVAQGLLSAAAMKEGMATISARYPVVLAESGQHRRAVTEYRRLRKKYGTSEWSRNPAYRLSMRTRCLGFLQSIGIGHPLKSE